jgi:aerobic-type carbon monoxide dehydrogenase small subunit (CoxS/CutS family)
MVQTKQLHVNGEARTVTADDDRSLLSVLREELKLTGAHYGCGEGQCGACTVLLEGKPVRSCITPIASVGNRPVITVEGLEKNGKLHPVQQAFLDADALQCGYCTPGMIMSSVGLLQKNPSPAEAEIDHALQGNVCRCGTYRRIVRAVALAAKQGKTTAHR